MVQTTLRAAGYRRALRAAADCRRCTSIARASGAMVPRSSDHEGPPEPGAEGAGGTEQEGGGAVQQEPVSESRGLKRKIFQKNIQIKKIFELKIFFYKGVQKILHKDEDLHRVPR